MNVLGIFVKYPRGGMVKTRLAASIGVEPAARLYASFIADIVERFRSTADARFLCHSSPPEARENYFHELAKGDYQLWPQPPTGLGERLQAFFEKAFQSAAERVIVLGSDSPTIPLEYMTDAFRLLVDHDFVLGPATDGGYYLIGVRRGAPGTDANETESDHRGWAIFDRIDWSTSQVFEQTKQRMEMGGASLAVLPPWYDIDTTEDLCRLREEIRVSTGRVGGASARHTAATLAEIDFKREDEPSNHSRFSTDKS